MSNDSTRKVIVIYPNSGERKRGTIHDYNPESQLHLVNLDDGSESVVFESALEFPQPRRVTWINRQTGMRKRGIIPAYDSTETIHLVNLEDGGDAYAMSADLEFTAELSQIDMERIAKALDGGSSMISAELKAENRAKIFKAIETCTHEDWALARSSCVHGAETLWQAVVRVHNTCGNSGDTPGREQIITALETKPDLVS